MKMTILKIAIITALIPVNSVHSLEIAKRDGVSDTYKSCSLTEGSRTLFLNRNLKETIHLEVPAEEILSKSNNALNNRGPIRYRWLSNQENYFVNGERFYAFGYETINNDSTASKELITIIDEVCERDLREFKIFGNFIFNLKIGSKLFRDIVNIDLIRDPLNKYPTIRGSYSVPNSFTAKIFDLKYDSGSFSFKIRVLEGDDDYIALFKGDFTDTNNLEGRAFILPEGKELGSFSGVRN